MTKLLQWVFGLGLFISLWLALLNNNNASYHYMLHTTLLPIYCLAVFGVVSVGIIAYRVYTFNDCESAAMELKKEIICAKDDLKKRGFMFDG